MRIVKLPSIRKVVIGPLFLTFLAVHPWPVHALSLPKPIPGEAQAISISGSTVKIKGLTHQTNKVLINGRESLVGPDGSFYEELIIPLGETEVKIIVTDPSGNEKVYAKKIKATENYLFAAGIADGTFNLSHSDRGISVERDSQHYKNGFRPHGKLAYYFAGKLNGKYLIKSALDTDKSTQDKLFTYIDPDKYYPIYGDNSTVVYDVNSQGKFYALVEYDKSGAIFGNYQTQIGGGGDETKFLTYNRTLYGGKVYLESPAKTIYGDAVSKATAFIAEANQHAGHSEFLATGGSLYYLRHRNIIEGSEQVRIEVRDKFSGSVISSAAQAQNIDYEIKYDEGRVLFRKPVSSTAVSDTVTSASVLQGNPVYVVVNYEYKNQEAFPISLEDLDEKTGGLSFSQHVGNHLRAGLTYVQEKKDEKHYKLVGGDTTVKIGNFTKLDAEIAHSEADSIKSHVSYDGGYAYTPLSIDNSKDGNAMRVHVNSALGEYLERGKEFLDVSAYWQRVDNNFAAADSLFEAGTQKFGADVSHEFGLNDRLRFLYERSDLGPGGANEVAKDQLTAKRIQNVVGQWIHLWNQWAFTSEYRFKDEHSSFSPITDAGKGRVKGHLLGERVQYDFSKDTSVFLGQQLGLTDLNDSFTSAGLRQKISDRIALSGEVGAGPAGNSVTAGLENALNATDSNFASYTLARSATDGRTSITSFGSNTKISETATLRREKQWVSSDARGVYKTNLVALENQITPELSFDASYQRRDENFEPGLTAPSARDAVSAAASYIIPDQIKVYSKAEYRLNSDNVRQVITDTQGEYKLTDDLFLYGEYEFSKATDFLSQIDKKQAALAYRPVRFDWFNALFKYIRFTDDRPQNLLNPDGGFLVTQSTSDVIATEFAIDTPYHFQIVQKLAFKDEEISAANITNTTKTPEDLQAFLWIHRLNYHLTHQADLAVEYRRLRQKGSSVRDKEHGILLEATYQIVKNIAVGAGFNFTAFTDDLTEEDKKSARGFFLRLQGKY